MEKKLIKYDSDDGLETPDVGIWAIEKYRILNCFVDIFSTGMKNVMDKRVYIDLFAGAGRAKIRENEQVVGTSATIALSVKKPFDKYIFCEQDEKKLSALEKRIERDFKERKVVCLHGDSNELVDQIKKEIPTKGKVLSFCFVDPFGINIDFETIKKLSKSIKMDFLILLAISMDANRNRDYYTSEKSDKLDRFFGGREWRVEFQKTKPRGNKFRRFIMTEYIKKMKSIGYIDMKPSEITYRVTAKGNISLYHLAFFSEHPLGYKFWNEAKKYGTDQLDLGL